MPKIEFKYHSEYANVTGNPPSSAVKWLPQWLKDLHRFPNKKIEPSGHGGVQQTIKACPPFLDAMMTGYMICLEFDLVVSIDDEGQHHFNWQAGGTLIDQHSPTQIHKSQIPNDFSGHPWKFLNFYTIKTPKNYSALFTHPVNRDDLPFRTLSGIVDTDLYKQAVNFPFLIRKNFEGIIPAGTPIVQIIPFKREAWTSSLVEGSKREYDKQTTLIMHKVMSGYKSLIWQRKTYK